MPGPTAIEWSEFSWNPVTGCSEVSPSPGHPYEQGFDLVRLWPERLKIPLYRRKPTIWFVSSMSDLFHELVPFAFVDAIVEVMAACPQHVFQVLTTRPERIRDFLAWQLEHGEREGFTANVWLGTSIKNRRFVERADYLRTLPVATRFISAEPLLGPLVYDTFDPERGPVWSDASSWPGADDGYDGPELDLTGIDWLIAGGESGPGHRPMRAEWARDLRDVCVEEGVAFFFKQWGGATPKAGGHELDGRRWRELPTPARGQVALELEGAA